MTIKRYSIYSSGNKTALEKEDGEWVKFEDVNDLTAKLTQTTDALDKFGSHSRECNISVIFNDPCDCGWEKHLKAIKGESDE